MEDKEWDSCCMNLIGSEHNANFIQVSIIDMWKLGPQLLYFIFYEQSRRTVIGSRGESWKQDSSIVFFISITLVSSQLSRTSTNHHSNCLPIITCFGPPKSRNESHPEYICRVDKLPWRTSVQLVHLQRGFIYAI